MKIEWREDWRKKTPKNVLDKMIAEKVDPLYRRPRFEDTVAKLTLSISENSVCLFYNVGAVIYKNKHVLSTGYNGPASGDIHCTEVGCARVVNGEIKSGTGICRGTHGELNAIGNAAKFGVNITGASIITSWRPCFTCAKQIVNAELKQVMYLYDYGDDNNVEEYLRKLHINMFKYESDYLSQWMQKFNGQISIPK